ncbi:MAG: hypothetical protein WCD53_01780 [Microcoleus sp.]
MDIRYFLDIIAIISGIASLMFWISSKHIYRDIFNEVEEIRKDMILLFENQEVNIVSRIERQIQRNIARISTSESRLEYLEKVIVKDENYSAFINKLGDLLEDSDFTK